MFRNYLITALRNLAKNRMYSAINVSGLAIGLAACLLILLFVRDELSYDTWLPNVERIAKLETTFMIPGREPIPIAMAPGPARARLEADFSSDVEAAVRIFETQDPVRVGERQFTESIAYVDASFFTVFDIPVAQGSRAAALANNASILLSARIAEKFFGDAPAVGKTLTLDGKFDYTVVGIFDALPVNTHLDLHLIALFDTARAPWIAEGWTSANTHTYVLFRTPEARARVERELPAFVDRNVEFDLPGMDSVAYSTLFQLNFLPVLDIHLHGRKPGHLKPGGDIVSVVSFTVIALLVLVIACINFVNLATARSMQRAREVAMRKVLGATRSQLVAQYLGEAVLTALIALVLAIALVELTLAPFNAFLDKRLALSFVEDPALVGIAGLLVAIVGALGGLYPAFHLSRFRPAEVLKANQSSVSGSPLLRNALVVFQFAISTALIVCTATVYAQTRYARTIDLGFDAREKLVLTGLADVGEASTIETLEREASALPGVRRAALSSDTPPLQDQNSALLFPTPIPSDQMLLVERLNVDADFFPLYRVEPIAGRLFSRDVTSDAWVVSNQATTRDTNTAEPSQSIVVNREFLRKLGIAQPQDAIGRVLWEFTDEQEPTVRTTIIGVVPDLYLRSVREINPPMAYFYVPTVHRFMSNLSLDVEPGQTRAVLAAVVVLWQRLIPDVPVRTSFVGDDIAAQYDADEQHAQIFGAFALLAVLLACLGLFGLASFAAERRTKEIGMRKVLGASVLDIVRLLVWQFSKPVMLANLVAWPVAFYVMRQWLSGFRYAIDLTDPALLLLFFGGAALLALAVAWSTTAGQAIRVARASPIQALRCE